MGSGAPARGEDWQDGLSQTPASLVCIGPGLDPAASRALAEAHFGEAVRKAG